jgi:hypothetical protein
MSDGGACCTRMILFTAAWSRAYAPPSPADHATVAVCERADGVETPETIVPTMALLAEFIRVLAPPVVTIKSATGEDISELQALVEQARAGRRLRLVPTPARISATCRTGARRAGRVEIRTRKQ